MNTTFTINARKYDGALHRSWSAELIAIDESLIHFRGVFADEVAHPEIGVIRPGTVSEEYYWLNKSYNVFRFSEPDGALKCFYCNVNQPPVFEPPNLDYIDLDIDILWFPGGEPRILDIDEFEVNSDRYSYPEELRASVDDTVAALLEMIRRQEFPFTASLPTL